MASIVDGQTQLKLQVIAGDHHPPHAHVFRNHRFLGKVRLDDGVPIQWMRGAKYKEKAQAVEAVIRNRDALFELWERYQGEG